MPSFVPAERKHADAIATLLAAELYADLTPSQAATVREALRCAVDARLRDPRSDVLYLVTGSLLDLDEVLAVRRADGEVLTRTARKAGAPRTERLVEGKGRSYDVLATVKDSSR